MSSMMAGTLSSFIHLFILWTYFYKDLAFKKVSQQSIPMGFKPLIKPANTPACELHDDAVSVLHVVEHLKQKQKKNKGSLLPSCL